ncbi:MAG: uncharacterized protein JWR28_250 [Modestobacter sp.]|nr:uncharacterized protein [Modestobacter sp.]
MGTDQRTVTTDLRLHSRRAVFTATMTLALAWAVASPASAHVEVSAEGAQAGTGPVTLVFSAESESNSAGIVSMKTQLPAGIAPADVTLASGPAGWALTPTADGFELAGPDIGPGVDAEYSITVAQLPADATELAFPTLQRYSDGRDDAWIEPITEAVPEPESPAPVLAVAPAPAGAAVPSSAAMTPSATETPAASSTEEVNTDDVAEETAEDSGVGAPVIVLLIVVLLAVIGGAVWVVRRRRA